VYGQPEYLTYGCMYCAKDVKSLHCIFENTGHFLFPKHDNTFATGVRGFVLKCTELNKRNGISLKNIAFVFPQWKF
jgi:hypothetical protein